MLTIAAEQVTAKRGGLEEPDLLSSTVPEGQEFASS